MKFGGWTNETKSGLRRINTARIVIILILTCSILLLIPLTASAWKPKHHIHTGNEAISEILGGQDFVTINGEQYSVSSEVAQAIRNCPAYYRAGCMGPDGFPDFVYGQMLIHPDNHDDGGTYTYEWLAHVFNSGWSYYNSHPGTEGQQALAFTYGYLTHAAGDLWGHTLINSFAGGA